MVGPGPRLQRRFAEPPAATRLTALGMREFPRHPRYRGRYACRSDMLIFRRLMRFPHRNVPLAILRDFGAVSRRIQAATALTYARMGLTTSHSVSAPSPSSLPPCSLCQRPCRPTRCFGPPDDCRCACRSIDGIGTGTSKAALRAGSKLGLRPASNRNMPLAFNSLKSNQCG